MVTFTSFLPFTRKITTVPAATEVGWDPRFKLKCTKKNKTFLSLMVFVIQTVTPAKSIGGREDEIWILVWKQKVSIRAQHEHQRAISTQITKYYTGQFRIVNRSREFRYTERKYIQRKYEFHTRLFNSLFFLTYFLKTRYPRKRKRGQGN